MNGSTVALLDEAPQEQAVTLFQFWDSNIPEPVEKLTQGVAQMNDEFAYLLFDDDGASDFISCEYGADTLEYYRSCVIPAMRADLFRYCYLAKRGGIYVDADYLAVSSLQPFVMADWKGCLYKRERGLANGMMYFRHPADPLAEKILELALHNIANRVSNNVWSATGPGVLQALHADVSNEALFTGIHFMEEPEFAEYFKPAPYLDYKADDSHWLVARQKGISIFRD